MTDLRIYLTFGIFAAVILAIAFDIVDMVVAALLGVSLMMLFRILNGKEILDAMRTGGGALSLLFGGMVVARVLAKTGIFERLGNRFLRATGGSGVPFRRKRTEEHTDRVLSHIFIEAG
jgi:Na+/H+ antiporter NhaD/arsenite permease-like protein